jgi:hypothetical protein
MVFLTCVSHVSYKLIAYIFYAPMQYRNTKGSPVNWPYMVVLILSYMFMVGSSFHFILSAFVGFFKGLIILLKT